MVKGPISGLMEEYTKENTKKIRKMGMGSINGLMVASMMASGLLANSMGKAHIQINRERQGWEYGNTVKGLNG